MLKLILVKNCLVLSSERHFFDEKSKDPIDFVNQAISQKRWMEIGMHGVAGQWLSTSVATLTKLVDHLIAKRSELWTAPTILVWKYIQERDAVASVKLKNGSQNSFTVGFKVNASKLESFNQPLAKLYDQALTLEVPVPASWSKFKVKQGSAVRHMAVVKTTDGAIARFEALPFGPPATVEREN